MQDAEVQHIDLAIAIDIARSIGGAVVCLQNTEVDNIYRPVQIEITRVCHNERSDTERVTRIARCIRDEECAARVRTWTQCVESDGVAARYGCSRTR